MTVYVDDMRRQARVGRINARWSHLQADTHEELVDFAIKLGLNPRWIQYPGMWKEHFDVTDSVRTKAIALGAKPIAYGGAESRDLARRKIAEVKARAVMPS